MYKKYEKIRPARTIGVWTNNIRPHVADVHSNIPVVPRPISADHGEVHLVHKQAEASEAL